MCKDGFEGNGESCGAVVVNECADAALDTCDPNAKCKDTGERLHVRVQHPATPATALAAATSTSARAAARATAAITRRA